MFNHQFLVSLYQQMLYMLPLGLLMGFLAIFVGFLLIKSSLKGYFKFIGIPVVIVASLFAFKICSSFLGYAYPAHLPDHFMFLGYQVVTTIKGEKSIELWLRSDVSKTRLYKIPYSQQMEDKLQDASEDQMKGQVVVGDHFRTEQGDGDITNEFKFYPFQLSKEIKKDAPTRRPIQ